MQIETDIKLDFSDVLIKPKRSTASSRSQVDLTRTYKFLNCYSDKSFNVGIPIIAANMSGTGTIPMAKTLHDLDCWTALHKFHSLEELEQFLKDEKDYNQRVFYTTGTSDEDYKKLRLLYKLSTPLPFICLDVANGYQESFVDKCKELRDWFPNSVLLAGNVCTAEMVQELLIRGGADIIKVGIGGGSQCRTRHVAGVGLPQLSAIIECADAAHGLGGHICSDGGCRTPGDVAKSFAAGADFVMLGGMLSGHDQCEGQRILDENGKVTGIKFFGMSSQEAMETFYGGKNSYRASEGKTSISKYKGDVKSTMEEILGGIRSTCTYVGTTKLKDLSKCTTFIRVNRIHDNPSI